MTTAHWEKVGAKTEAGPDVTTRRIVTPKPGLVYHESGSPGDSVAAEGKVKLKGWLKGLKDFSGFKNAYITGRVIHHRNALGHSVWLR